MTATGAFRHVEHERTLVFGAGALDAATDLFAQPFTLLTTPRAAADPLAAALVARAAARVDVPAGLVEEVAAELRPGVSGSRLVALGGGRVIDVAKALAVADPPRTVVAVPTTLSAAEMTGKHRQARGVPAGTPFARPAAVVNDPALSASAPVELLAASSANALAHALVATAAARSSPLAAAVARDAVAQLAAAWTPAAAPATAPAAATPAAAPALAATPPALAATPPAPAATPLAATRPPATPSIPNRSAAALGALLAGWAVDHSGLGLHHVLAQTAVRTAALGHAQANAALLPVTATAIRRRAPAAFAALDVQLGGAPSAVESLARTLRDAAGLDPGAGGLDALAADERLLERAVEAAAARPELARIPPAPDRAELRALFLAAAAR
ncbi:dehydroquinate synthase/iron-containing alcohol dehydrogenase family protein [Conexibacter woesei]|uniref:Iron-containing alcohol dehydrogenase n=1 Tax=Conexibacter woesei (strain DSM 14684 / CCUG 47730 / CIP 108061 / JCM 11494 / NBRC 100937 / ID131577) TaxID=469383 RepID=D3F3C8_CONWI|nr:iron-containing alcohol dehydrogenase [Conexibacter woesei]ADB50408.1 iron-containing alcohol dehydrogenase [Conexibacter woesei DSM 14684]